MNSSAPWVVKRRSRYARRFSSVDSTPIESKRFLIVPSLSSAARMPFPGATSSFAVCSRRFVSIHSLLFWLEILSEAFSDRCKDLPGAPVDLHGGERVERRRAAVHDRKGSPGGEGL